jgi:hypothetical protein
MVIAGSIETGSWGDTDPCRSLSADALAPTRGTGRLRDKVDGFGDRPTIGGAARAPLWIALDDGAAGASRPAAAVGIALYRHPGKFASLGCRQRDS